MKTMRYIVLAAAVCTALASCVKEPAVYKFSGPEGMPVEVKFNLQVPERAVESRSLAADLPDDGVINDLNVFVFNATDGSLDGYAYAWGLTGGTGTQCSVRGTSGMRTLAVIANAGKQLDQDITNLSSLNALTADAFIVKGYALMAGTLQDVEVNPGDGGSKIVDVGEIILYRLMSKVTVVFDKSELNMGGAYDEFIVDIQSVSLKQVPSAFTYLSPNTPSAGFMDGDYIYPGDGEIEPANHASAIPLYMPENMQGTKYRSPDDEHYLAGDTLDLGLRYSSPITMVPRAADIGKCSYVEVRAVYDRYITTPLGPEGSYGEVIYKIFLGSGLSGVNWNNFDVRRNTWYKVTVKLTNDAGKMEASWRIETDLDDYSDEPDPTGDSHSYTIDPDDALYWTTETPLPMRLTYAGPSQNLKLDEYYEGRRTTYLLVQQAGNINNFPAAAHCHALNAGNTIDQIIYYLPAQNELQMLNIHRNTSFEDYIYWSSTQLQEGDNPNQNARVINYANFGEAYTQHKGTEAIVRCLRVPDRSDTWDGKVYPYVDNSDGYPVVVNRDTNPDGTPRGAKSFALRTGAYNRLTPYYHRIVMPYKAFRVAVADCGAGGEQVVPGSERLDWYQAMGYLRPDPLNEAENGENYAPRVNPAPTGCNAYYEDGDLTQMGKWRLPTTLELQQLWIMGASSRGSRPADPNVTPYLNPDGSVNQRLPGISDLTYPGGYAQVYGNNATLLANTLNIGMGTIYPTYSLENCYWSSSTTTRHDAIYENHAYAYKMDLYSGDGYSGIETCLARPLKTNPGLVRCVMDVER